MRAEADHQDGRYFAFGRFEKRHKIDSKPFRLVLLAETNQGYKNLMKISTVGFMEGFITSQELIKRCLKSFALRRIMG